MRVHSLFAVGLGVLSLAAAACGGSDEPPPQTPTQTAPPPATTPAPVVTTPPAASSSPPAPVAATGPCTQVAPAAGDAANPVLDGMAKTDAKGMKAEGSAFAGQCQEGQTLEQTFNAVPGKCYTVFAVGLGMQQVDVQAMTISPSPMIPSMTVATSATSGPNANIGGGGNCVKYPLPVGGPFKIVVKATKGSGVAVARVYSK